MTDDAPADVFIATPTYDGNVWTQYVNSLLQTFIVLGQHGFASSINFMGGNAMISFARAIMTQDFIDSGSKYLLFIDADVSWDPKGAARLIMSPHDVIAGVYPAKIEGPKPVFQTLNLRETGSQNLVETDGVPAGFLRISRKAVLKMKEAYPEQRCLYKNREVHLLFEPIIMHDGLPLGEDYAFCERWRRTGGKVFIDPCIDFEHYGRKIYKGNMLDDSEGLKAIT